VHAFDLTKSERKHFAFDPSDKIARLAVTDDGARLFAVSDSRIFLVDAHSGAVTALSRGNSADRGRRISDQYLNFGMGCVIDAATRSLVICDYTANAIVRIRGVDV
jgi:hypothetical protein